MIFEKWRTKKREKSVEEFKAAHEKAVSGLRKSMQPEFGEFPQSWMLRVIHNLDERVQKLERKK